MTPEDIKHLQVIKEYLSGIRGCEFEGMARKEMPWLVEKLESLAAAPSGGDGPQWRADPLMCDCKRVTGIHKFDDNCQNFATQQWKAGGESAPEPPACVTLRSDGYTPCGHDEFAHRSYPDGRCSKCGCREYYCPLPPAPVQPAEGPAAKEGK